MKNNRKFKAGIFDLDGVITKTALVHALAWKEMFDEYLRLREKRDKEPFKEFTYEEDYLVYVDGKPRYKGVQSFLESRGICIAFGEKEDSEEKETICGLGNKKNIQFRQVLKEKGVEIYSHCISFIKDLKKNGIRVGVASSSKNCRFVLQSAGIEELFETRVDGEVSLELGLKGKPESDIFVKAAERLGVTPEQAVVVEDAVSGVQAGKKGDFRLVIGVARENNEKELKENGADVVISSFERINTQTVEAWIKEKING